MQIHHVDGVNKDGLQTEAQVLLPTMYSRSMKGSLMATISTFLEVKAARVTRRPIRPNLENFKKRKEISLDCRW